MLISDDTVYGFDYAFCEGFRFRLGANRRTSIIIVRCHEWCGGSFCFSSGSDCPGFHTLRFALANGFLQLLKWPFLHFEMVICMGQRNGPSATRQGLSM